MVPYTAAHCNHCRGRRELDTAITLSSFSDALFCITHLNYFLCFTNDARQANTIYTSKG